MLDCPGRASIANAPKVFPGVLLNKRTDIRRRNVGPLRNLCFACSQFIRKFGICERR
jgi:hypothetical protein